MIFNFLYKFFFGIYNAFDAFHSFIMHLLFVSNRHVLRYLLFSYYFCKYANSHIFLDPFTGSYNWWKKYAE